ncbi:MAG: bifunctional hydroxymethylpyrimidine kinase/phosphomethylpyrimidine kinase [Wenzhouxiangellaceae bacterium]|nr:bifunctional hydroxymethylpyrimidine kinase/phosphomethylpyrimidine kinase [Wenzhouxiangellaceae bacterium]
MAEKQQRGRQPVAALTIAGSDSGGGAGIQADLKTFAAFDVFGASAITAVTAQNTLGVARVAALEPAMVEAQIEACLEDLPVGAVKLGMLAEAGIVHAVADALERDRNRCARSRVVIVDPVMVATSGARLLTDDAVAAIVERLLPLATLVTPNLPEARVLAGTANAPPGDAPERLGARIVELGAAAALVKGGHAEGGTCSDWLVTAEAASRREWPRAPGRFHGTGCAYSAAIAALMARGAGLEDAVDRAGEWLQVQIRTAFEPLRGPLKVLPFTPAAGRQTGAG